MNQIVLNFDEIEPHTYQIGSYRHPEWLTVPFLRNEVKDYYLDRKAANGIIKFFESHIRHMHGDCAGKVITLEPWQKKSLRRI